MLTKIPLQIQGLIWSKRGSNLDLQQDQQVIIHHVLRYGRIDDISWLLKTYPHEQITNVFFRQPLTIYSPSALHFAKSTILNINKELPNEHKYIQSFS